uniref:Putative group i salivary lipocalin n=1 Tax=Rhipicephalus pulchellus TaxID=72859 RepID=L7LSZ6_RHIPC
MTAGMRIRDALLFAVLLKVAHCGGGSYKREVKHEDIAQFYSSTATIRTLYTTMHTDGCKVDTVRTTDYRHTEFNRNYTSQNNRPSLELVGTFINILHGRRDVPFNGMDINMKTGQKLHWYEELLFTFDSLNCGIFFVSTTWGRKGKDYELRVRSGSSASRQCYEELISYARRAGVVASKFKNCTKNI